ncbi:MAG TPA: sensor histidine kinase [Ktedonobacteraceae bacterium]|jgi:signal transduction histidine kinase|nr:sensor histidine kinase [Ktedonobacteraceae bacterium]
MRERADMHALPDPAEGPGSALEQPIPYEERGRPASYILALACLWLVFLIYPVVGLLQVTPRPVPLALGLAGSLAFFSLYFWTIWRIAFTGMAGPPWRSLSIMSALALALPLLLGATWQGFFVYAGLLAGFALRLRHMIVAVAVMVALTVLVAAVTHAPWWETAALVTVTILGSGMASAIRRLRAINEQLRAAQRQIAALAASEERLRLARELHDSVKQQAFVTSMEIGAARALLDRDRAGARAHLHEAEGAIRQLQLDLKALVQALRPAPLEDQSLMQAIQAYSAAWSQRTHIAAAVHLHGERATPRAIEQALFRVVQEALTNIEKHSAASRVVITLTWSDQQLQVQIADDGRGFIPQEARGRGYGLLHMRERVAALQGELDIKSRPGGGTTITCTCPLQLSERGAENA